MRGDRKWLPPVVEKLRIAFIRENPDIVLPAEGRNTNELVVFDDGATRVVR
jgi:hypothetical protein